MKKIDYSITFNIGMNAGYWPAIVEIEEVNNVFIVHKYGESPRVQGPHYTWDFKFELPKNFSPVYRVKSIFADHVLLYCEGVHIPIKNENTLFSEEIRKIILHALISDRDWRPNTY